MEANVMSVRFTVSPCVLLDPGGAGGAIVTRRPIFPSLVTAALPKGTDAEALLDAMLKLTVGRSGT